AVRAGARPAGGLPVAVGDRATPHRSPRPVDALGTTVLLALAAQRRRRDRRRHLCGRRDGRARGPPPGRTVAHDGADPHAGTGLRAAGDPRNDDAGSVRWGEPGVAWQLG